MASFERITYRRVLYFAVFIPISGVLCFSELFFIKEPHDVMVLRKDPVILDCQARGEVPVPMTWLKNGVKVTENERVYALSNGSLYIAEVENRRGDKSDEGFYQCLAQNKYGAILSQKARLTIASISPFEVQPVSSVVEEGSVARFTCKIHANPPPIITWEFNRTILPLATNRITVLPNGVLQIYGVNQGDAGNYRCVATNIANRRRSIEATLTVTSVPEPRPPQKPRIIAGPQNITTTLHQSAILECVATGNPKPIISWSRLDHKSIDVFNTRVLGNGNLIISDVKLQHAGVYVCRATTPGTRNFTVATAALAVLAPPSFVEWPESLTRPRAGTARFVCLAEGIPKPKTTWLKNGLKIHSNGRIKMYNSKLVINQIIPEDDAIYQCMAENDQGSILSMARLIVVMSEDRPSTPRNVRPETVSSSAILLAWDRPLYNSDKVIAYSVHYMKAEGLNNEEYQVVIGNETTRYIIDDLEPASNYTFYIVAYMPMGASRMSDHVSQHTFEDVPLRAPEISLTSRSLTDIQVSWLPIPAKFSRGRIVTYRLSYRVSSESTINTLEIPGAKSKHLIEGLDPDTIYLLRIAAATKIGWGEQSVWTSHRTPKASSAKGLYTPTSLPGSCTTSLSVREHDVRRMLLAVNPKKAVGPDGVPGKVLRACAHQLAHIFTRIFNLSLAQAVIPSCLKSATIIPVLKKSPITSLNDYRPVALTPVIMKCFERLVLRHIKDYLPSDFDPYQFAYRANRSTEDAIAVALHSALSHLEQQQSYVRMLFVDYSSAFNTIIPDILITKLVTLGLPPLTCAWIKDFLTNRPQTVRLGPYLSSTRTLSTGSPQGCVLSPLLYCLYTHDCSPAHNNNLIVKFADDTTVVGLISKGDEAAYREEVLKLAAWCSENNLALNTKKTKEIIVDFRKHNIDLAPLFINGECVERVHTFRFLGVLISADISWTDNITAIIKKAQQRLHFLRVLRKYNLDSNLLLTFYRSSVESLLTYCITVWYGSCTVADRERLQRVIRAAQKIIGCPLPSLMDIYTSRCLSRGKTIIKDSSHPGSDLFNLLPSGRRYRCIRTRTNRFKNSFFPKVITTLNLHMH